MAHFLKLRHGTWSCSLSWPPSQPWRWAFLIAFHWNPINERKMHRHYEWCCTMTTCFCPVLRPLSSKCIGPNNQEGGETWRNTYQSVCPTVHPSVCLSVNWISASGLTDGFVKYWNLFTSRVLTDKKCLNVVNAIGNLNGINTHYSGVDNV